MTTSPTKFRSMNEFYPFYLGQHTNRTCRRLHFAGTTLALLIAAYAVYTGNWWLIIVAILQGYAWAWVGHFFFEHNRPATFTHPLYSFAGDWYMWFDVLRGRVKL
ncbi:Mpo1-like protein [Lysobacter sp. A289]